MTDTLMRGFIRAFCDALAAHDPNLVAAWLDDDIDWTIYGPVDLFPFFGQRRGKAEVLAMMCAIDACLEFKDCDRDSGLTEGEQSAALVRVTTVHKRTGRTLSLRLARFAQFRNGKLTRLRAVFDTFDAAEQMLGRELDISAAA